MRQFTSAFRTTTLLALLAVAVPAALKAQPLAERSSIRARSDALADQPGLNRARFDREFERRAGLRREPIWIGAVFGAGVGVIAAATGGVADGNSPVPPFAISAAAGGVLGAAVGLGVSALMALGSRGEAEQAETVRCVSRDSNAGASHGVLR